MNKTNNTIKELDEELDIELDIEIQQRLINIHQYSRYLGVYSFNDLGSFEPAIYDIYLKENKKNIVRFIRGNDTYIIRVNNGITYNKYSINSKSKYNDMVDFIHQELKNIEIPVLVINDLMIFLIENSLWS